MTEVFSTWLRRGSAKLHVFVGDDFLTLSREGELRKCGVKLNGGPDVKEVVRDDERFMKTEQFRVMAMMGFKKLDPLGMVFGKWDYGNEGKSVKIRFYNSRVKEILVDGQNVETYSMEVEYDKKNASVLWGGRYKQVPGDGGESDERDIGGQGDAALDG